MKPWREVAKPHKDVLAGTFQQSDFAADISRVVNRTATAEYQDAESFFARTYVTEGMKHLLVAVARRLNGLGDEPVIELRTNFGGGKTHTLLAVYHMATYEGSKTTLPGVADVLKAAGVSDVPEAKVAVIDGTALAPNQPQRKGGYSIRTLWGSLAYQLLGADGYAKVAESDAAGTSPGKVILEDILRSAGPCVILMDELVAYYRQFNTGERLSGGTYESNMSFAQALTEAVKGAPNAILLATLPESEGEAGGGFGYQALGDLVKVFGRINAIWRPVSAEEGFEIVKRRLFESVTDEAAMEETCRTFAAYYHENRAALPADVQDATWGERMRKCYPIHPEVFIRLYEDWSTLDKFQKTRGVLQYMAIVINRLWEAGSDEPMIMPASIPLADSSVANKATQFLPNGWNAVLGSEIDGAGAAPERIDQSDPRLGAIDAAVRVARTIFMGSAASTDAQAVRGIDRKRILLGCGIPGQELSFYEDAIGKLREKLQFLFMQNDHYWYDTRPNLSRTMGEIKERIKDAAVRECLEMALKERWGAPGAIADKHVFEDDRGVPDDVKDGIRVVVLPPDDAYSAATAKSVFDVAKRYLDKCGTQPRMRKNRLVFLALDLSLNRNIKDVCKTKLAWREVRELISNGGINTTRQEADQVEGYLRQSTQMLKGLVGEGFKYLIVPVAEGIADLGFDVRKMTVGMNENIGDVVQRTLEGNEYIVEKWAPEFLRDTLMQYYFKDGCAEVPTRKVWQDMASYYNFPRLVSHGVFIEAVRGGVKGGLFGYAVGKAEDGAYVNFKFAEEPGMIGISDAEMLIKKDVAEAYRAKEAKVTDDEPSTPKTPMEGTNPVPTTSTSVPVIPTPSKRKFVGNVKVDVTNGTAGLQQIVDEVIANLAAKGFNAAVSLEITAQGVNPFSPSLVRTVNENANSLGFTRVDFS